MLVSVALLFAIGCNCQDNLEFCQEENQALTQQIAELEYQLNLADEAAAAQASSGPAFVDEAVYLVVEGDSLWQIAKKQLGSGKRYKEILALNPQITKDAPLAIGTKLKMPPR